ncbi:MAG: FAD-dependent oxidoreductase, partial [Candidatus Sumerlaeota bacterium]|nr:FAD-dependent oxidoreductase [Candidatus Sumerlaeota bacterium]
MGRRVVVIGGVACGPNAASRLRRLDPQAEITIVEQGEYTSYAGCGLPYYVGGDVKDINGLLATPAGAVRNPGFFKKVKNIALLNRTRAESIDRARKTVRVRDLASGAERDLPYDQLVIATGASAVRPPIAGLDLKGVHQLTRIEHALELRDAVA